jgi:hypothetical protein
MNTNGSSATRQSSAVLAIGGGTLLLLLKAHPQAPGHLRSFQEVVNFEIEHRAMDALVHGGAIAVLVLLLAGHAGLLRAIRCGGVAGVLAVTAFGTGCALIAASLVLDGFLTPALALQFRDAQGDQPRQEAVEAVLHACGSAIGILMRMGLSSFAAAALAWSAGLLQAQDRRIAAALSGVTGLILGVLMLWPSAAALDHTVMAGVLLLGVWQLALAAALWRHPVVSNV